MDLDSLGRLAVRHADSFETVRPTFVLRGNVFGEAPSLMGVVNMSSDSWYRESVVLSTEAAIRRGKLLALQGAALVDIGAESTLPNAERVSPERQADQLVPVVDALARDGLLVSIETYEASVAERCLNAGAAVVNLTGRKGNEAIYRAVAEHDAGVIVCFVAGDHVRSVDARQILDDPIPELYEYFARQVEEASRCGVTRIWLDPGLGFYYKNLSDSDQRIRFQLDNFLNGFRLRSIGFPICNALPHAFEHFGEEVRTAEAMFAVVAMIGGTTLFRTHEVPKVKAVVDTLMLWRPA
jgi:dihydropteroate synthase